MPFGYWRNAAYGLIVDTLGMRSPWKAGGEDPLTREIAQVLIRHHTVGAGLHCFEGGRLTKAYSFGYARLGKEPVPVKPDTVFRTASLAKSITALLVFRLAQQGLLDIQEDISALLGFPARNPHFSEVPITLGMLMNHTSSIHDSEAYFSSMAHPVNVGQLLSREDTFLPARPGEKFEYSNFAAGLIGCLLEKRFGMDLDALARRELFDPLGAEASYRIETFPEERLSDSWRVWPKAHAFDAPARRERVLRETPTDPMTHYLKAAGNVYLTPEALARLALLAADGQGGLLSESSRNTMRQTIPAWHTRHEAIDYGMGIFRLTDATLLNRPIYGHLGFAYGAVNSFFFDEEGNGFAMLTSGTSERRVGHLSAVNRALIPWLMPMDARHPRKNS